MVTSRHLVVIRILRSTRRRALDDPRAANRHRRDLIDDVFDRWNPWRNASSRPSWRRSGCVPSVGPARPHRPARLLPRAQGATRRGSTVATEGRVGGGRHDGGVDGREGRPPRKFRGFERRDGLRGGGRPVHPRVPVRGATRAPRLAPAPCRRCRPPDARERHRHPRDDPRASPRLPRRPFRIFRVNDHIPRPDRDPDLPSIPSSPPLRRRPWRSATSPWRIPAT